MSIETNYIPTIGLEIHTELKTKSKLFCGCKNDPFARDPNIYTCPVCLGLPGALPVINKQAVIDTIKIGKALDGTIAPITKWDRKHYFYPDLPKGYQISQFDMPLVTGGSLEITNSKLQITNKSQNINDENEGIATSQAPRNDIYQRIRITRIHLEEDTGKLVHDKDGSSLVDLNRAGVPLVELVTEPDIHDAKTAAEFAREYQLILRTLGVADADMEKGQLRCEINISLRDIKYQKSNIKNTDQKSKIGELGTKVEIKNLNSFKSVEKAIEYEIKRQTELLEKGEPIVQETRGWDDARGTTISQRTKETSADYRYFPEPDLPPIDTTKLKIESDSPLPAEIRKQLSEAGINEQEIEIIIKRPELLEKLALPDPSLIPTVANIIIHNKSAISKTKAELVELAKMSAHNRKAALLGQEIGVKLNDAEIEEIIGKVLSKNIRALNDYQSGKLSIYGFLVGQVMRECRGQADPATVNDLLKSVL